MKTVIWTFWANEKTMSGTRKKAFQTLVNNSEVQVELITDNNYLSFEDSNLPIHKAYQYLSDTHKSDYLRFYLCHIYGGGYSDIKPFPFSWAKYFKLINEDIDLVGSPEIKETDIASQDHKKYFKDLISVHHFIMKKNCKISLSIISEINKILDTKYELLKNNNGNYHPRAVSKELDRTGVYQPTENKIYESNYPLSWNEINGRVFHKIQYENKDRICKQMPSDYNCLPDFLYR